VDVVSVGEEALVEDSGEAGEEASVILELRLIADVGIIGYPNTGKSGLKANELEILFLMLFDLYYLN